MPLELDRQRQQAGLKGGAARWKKLHEQDALTPGHRRCSSCHALKKLEEFYAHKISRGGRRRQCKKCTLARGARWRNANKPLAARLSRAGDLRRNFGLSLEDFDRLVEEQSGRCLICQEVPKRLPLRVDHDHVTGAVRGLLCHKCNSAIGLLGDDPERLRRAAAYVTQAQ